ncbi:MAG: S8 family serine peptidase [Polyangiales bacterium]
MKFPTRSMLGPTSAALFLMACAQVHEGADETSSPSPKVPDPLRVEVAASGGEDVLVELDESAATLLAQSDAGTSTTTQPSAAADGTDAEGVQTRAALYRSLQERLLAAPELSAVELRVQYQHLPLLLLHVKTPEALEALAARPEVLRIHEDRRFEHHLTRSLAQIRQPAALAAGKGGAGTSVVVLDTGCDFTRADFGSCSAPGAPGCKVAHAADFAANDGSRDDHGHGTNVSAIVLGVAPSTKIIALDVFAGGGAMSNVILQAIDWSIQNRAKYNIVALNMSLGSGSNTASCSNDVFASAVANARASGILAAVASGNNGYSNAISSPACVPAAISVGAVYSISGGNASYASGCKDTNTQVDQITCFSNSSSFLSMLAPGATISAGGYAMAGTSQAAPHVAGALAVLRSAFPTEAVSDTVARLVNNGPELTDPRNKVKKRRLDLQAALAGVGAAAPSADRTGPTGSVTINANAEVARSTAVSLTIAGSDPSGVSAMCVSSTNVCTSFQPFATSLSWSLPTGDGAKAVYVTLRDTLGNTSLVSDTIRLDATAPTGGGVAINGGAQYTKSASVSLKLAASDASGVAGMCISNTTTCSAWTPFVASKTWTLAASSGVNKVYVWYKDIHENVTAQPATASITVDAAAPTQSAFAATASARQVGLSWTAAVDASGIESYKLYWQTGSVAPASCGAGSLAYSGTALGYTHTSRPVGTFSYRLCAYDRAGNASAGLTKTVSVR